MRHRGIGVAARWRHPRDGTWPIAMTALLRATDLHVAYGDERALKGVDLEVVRGALIALIGPNGSGKTTLLRALVGTVPLEKGNVCIGGHDLAAAAHDAKTLMGFAVDPASLPDLLTGRECLALFAGARDLSDIPTATLALSDVLSLTDVLDRRIANYSLGMRQKLGILLGLLGEPPLLLLDEPFNGLDPRSALAFKQHLASLVADRGVSVLLATHSLGLAERYATRALLLIDGRLQRSWMASELADLRERPGCSLEQAMAEACIGPNKKGDGGI
ncbi:MAG: ABC transporter ATP-binding protein [Xanthomonadales bacterium]|nr:ABC transporter ATP-binding protein [Xanthomonadales bacterium]